MRNGNKEAALHYYERTAAMHASDTTLLEYADALLLSGRTVDARKVLDSIVCKTRGAHMRKEELMLYLPPAQMEEEKSA